VSSIWPAATARFFSACSRVNDSTPNRQNAALRRLVALLC
jgi:hypothetical protein